MAPVLQQLDRSETADSEAVSANDEIKGVGNNERASLKYSAFDPRKRAMKKQAMVKEAMHAAFFDELEKIALLSTEARKVIDTGLAHAMGEGGHFMPGGLTKAFGHAAPSSSLRGVLRRPPPVPGTIKPRIAMGEAGLAPHLRGGEDVLTSAPMM